MSTLFEIVAEEFCWECFDTLVSNLHQGLLAHRCEPVSDDGVAGISIVSPRESKFAFFDNLKNAAYVQVLFTPWQTDLESKFKPYFCFEIGKWHRSLV
jgi:hypothetical protein